MAQIFKPAANTLARVSLLVGAATPFALIVGGSIITRAPWNTKVNVPLDQPVPFSHQHHALELGIDCRFCHTSVDKSAAAGVPSTEVCMTCHSQIWTNSPNLEPIRDSFQTNTPVQWNKVNKVPEFVYFDHSIHINRGVSCNHCHGAVQSMQITSRGRYFSMDWCLQCHRDPGKYLYTSEGGKGKPEDQVFALYEKLQRGEKLTAIEQGLSTGGEQRNPDHKDGEIALKERGVKVEQLTDCWTCHR